MLQGLKDSPSGRNHCQRYFLFNSNRSGVVLTGAGGKTTELTRALRPGLKGGVQQYYTSKPVYRSWSCTLYAEQTQHVI